MTESQSRNIWRDPSFSKLITEMTGSQSKNIWKDQWCLAEVVYIYAWQQHTYQWPDSFRKNSQIWHLKLSVFQEFGYFPLFIIFFPKLCWYSQRFYNSKNLPIRKNSQTPRGLELHEFNCIINKINKTIGLLPKCKNFLPRKSLLTIYKPFIRPHLDYGDIIYDQTYNASFHQRLESLQYNAALPVTGAIRGNLKEKLYNELGLESLQNRRWYRKLSFLYKVIANQSPSYLFNMIPRKSTSRPTRGSDNIPLLGSKHIFFPKQLLSGSY